MDHLSALDFLNSQRSLAEMHRDCVERLIAAQDWALLNDSSGRFRKPNELPTDFLRMNPLKPDSPEVKAFEELLAANDEEYRIRTAAYHQYKMWLGYSRDLSPYAVRNGRGVLQGGAGSHGRV